MTDADGSTDRLVLPGRIRVPRAAIGAAVLGLSMLLSAAPALGAGNNGNGNGNSSTPPGNGTSGNVKVNDATTGAETSGTDNEPHVCAFWLSFTFDAPFEAGTWVVVSWAPTGDGSAVASGVYDTAGDGVDSSGIIRVAAGHYRVEWAATGATSSKKKTFWVDADCPGPGAPADEEPPAEEAAPPIDAPGSPVDEVPPAEDVPVTEEPVLPAAEPTAEEPAPPSDAPAAPAEEEPQLEEGPVTDELVLSEAETAPTDDAPQADEETASSEGPSPAEDVAPNGPEGAPATDQPPAEDVTPPLEVADDEVAAQAADPGTGEGETPPSQGELAGTGGSDEPAMPDTAVPGAPVQGGPSAMIGLLVLITLHLVQRQDLRSDRDNGVTAA